jgi:hypothetical protein
LTRLQKINTKLGYIMYVLIFYVPAESKEKVKRSCFDAGAGVVGNYDHCCFETEGVGQFRPLFGANPAIGSVGGLEYVKEVRVEMIVQKQVLGSVINALKVSHPYEEVAYHVLKHQLD